MSVFIRVLPTYDSNLAVSSVHDMDFQAAPCPHPLIGAIQHGQALLIDATAVQGEQTPNLQLGR